MQSFVISAHRFLSTLPQGERPGGMRPTHDLQTISIHAPARGATAWRRGNMPLLLNFYPRSRKGSDEGSLIVPFCINISIHAPARGATQGFDLPDLPAVFLSTLPQGERLSRIRWRWKCSAYFYPRSRKGSDHLVVCPPHRFLDFYPRSRKGSDVFGVVECEEDEYFYPRSRKGSDSKYDDIPLIFATVYYTN